MKSPCVAYPMAVKLLPIQPLDREIWRELSDQQFAALNDNIAWVLHHATDIHGEPLTIEERNTLIARHNASLRAN
jgi:hypothetical protein